MAIDKGCDMPKFSKRSEDKLYSCQGGLIDLFEVVVREFDCTILCGYRGEVEQQALFEQDYSQVQYPDSKHNFDPSMAVDAAPWPIDWNDIGRFYYFAGHVKAFAYSMGLDLVYGGDWNDDTQVKDNKFNDLVHFQLGR